MCYASEKLQFLANNVQRLARGCRYSAHRFDLPRTMPSSCLSATGPISIRESRACISHFANTKLSVLTSYTSVHYIFLNDFQCIAAAGDRPA